MPDVVTVRWDGDEPLPLQKCVGGIWQMDVRSGTDSQHHMNRVSRHGVSSDVASE